jgi:hypothetical protein
MISEIKDINLFSPNITFYGFYFLKIEVLRISAGTIALLV